MIKPRIGVEVERRLRLREEGHVVDILPVRWCVLVNGWEVAVLPTRKKADTLARRLWRALHGTSARRMGRE
ncbi:MAG TPA: hypothetical protein VMB05_05570, partial [Solirubrobacteraceae bacterium]|nr:hypothetical protein [Solirubrobacteraceae bacterium]